jgi:hypothetical protein
MNVNLNVLGTTMLHWVGRHVHSGDIVTIDKCDGAEKSMKFLEELA